MKAIQLADYGGPEQLRFEDAADPSPAPGQVLVRVRATAVNPWDLKLASGKFRDSIPMTLPYVPGHDFSGVVEALGEGVTSLSLGQEVFGHAPIGAYAELVVAPADATAPKPANIPHESAAAVPLAGQTAWQGLFEEGGLHSGETVLIHAAAGGVGSFAVQFARWKGARIYATASADHAEAVKRLGADVVIDYKAQRFEEAAREVDLVLDLIGGETRQRSFAILKPGGRLISTVFPPPTEEESRRHNVRAATMNMKPSAKRLSEIARLIDSGDVRPLVGETFALSQAAEAWRLSRTGLALGKIVLRVG